MELSDPAPQIEDHNAPNRRKSGRAKVKPVTIYEDSGVASMGINSAKRKRAELRGGEAGDVDNNDSDESDGDQSSQESEGDADEEEIKETRKRASKKKKVKESKKPATKKARTANQTTTNLAIRPAANGVKKPSKARKPRARPKVLPNDANSLYGKVFSGEESLEEVAAHWIEEYQAGRQTDVMCGLVNLVLKCTGCDLEVDIHDIDDPDNAASRLTDLQEEFQAQNITDYPLISKAKANVAFRTSMTSFFRILIQTAHASSLLYDDLALIENIETWITAMTSSGNRPFRHTSTVIALTISSTICGIVAELKDSTAKSMRQKEGEQKKKSVNKDRVAALAATIKEGARKREIAESKLKDVFDAVFVHRYRDVDPRIRVDCVTALGSWITSLPDVFFEGQYLRYLGWVLSDTSAPTRAEVIKQLSKLFKSRDNIGRLRAFTERFRPRMVEIAVRDAESSNRISAIQLLDSLRDSGLLEPDDIDTVGKLIFDSEPRVRKAVAPFFVENVNDHFESSLEELGGEESIDEALGEENEDDYDAPRKRWLKIKCLAEVLQSCDPNHGEKNGPAVENGVLEIKDTLNAMGNASRYTLAAQAICEGLAEIKDWEILAGYLLYDHSTTDQAQTSDDPITTFKARCQPNEREETLLLEVLNEAVKQRLTDAIESEADKKGKKSKARKEESRQIQETAALHLAQVLPKLLKKYGANSTTASAVLRLEHALDLEIFQVLRQDSTTFASLLDDINKQFLSHTDPKVLAEASTALLHARGFDDLEEVTEGKVQQLWEDTGNVLQSIMTGKEATYDNTELCNTVRRISNLASVSDCVSFMDTPVGRSAKSSESATPRTILSEIVYNLQAESDTDDEGDETAINAMKALLFYYMWAARTLKSAMMANEPINSIPDYSTFIQSLEEVLETRNRGADVVRLAATETLLDLYTLFATFRHLRPPSEGNSNQETEAMIKEVVKEISPKAEALVTSAFIAAERAYAKRSKRNLELAEDDNPLDDGLDSDPEDSEDEDEDEDYQRAQQRQHDILLSEKHLCELAGKIVLAIVGRAIDSSGARKGKLKERLLRNKTKLGANYKEVVAFLEAPKAKKSHKTKVKPPKTPKETAVAKSRETVADDDDIEEEDDVDELARVEEEEEEEEEAEGRGIADEDGDRGGHEGEVAESGGGDEEDDIMGD